MEAEKRKHEAEEERRAQEAESARQRLAIIQGEAVRKIENAAKRKEKVRNFFGRR